MEIAEGLELSISDVIGQRIAVLGISGSGKTNTVAVLAEEMLPHLPMTIVDVESEYFGLKECYDLLVAGRSEHAEVPLFVENASAIAEMSIRRGISVILDLSEYDQDEMQAILLAYFEHLWKCSTELKTPYEIVIEESHEFVPQSVRTPLKTVLTRFALRGRKRGVGVILASQRSAKVEKDLLTQANLLFLQNVVHPTDLSVYKDLIPLPAKDVEAQARELVPGEAFVVRGKMVDRVHVRLRHTFHAGATPTLDAAHPQLKTIDAALLRELSEITKRAVKDGGSDELTKVKRQLKDAEAKIVEQEKIIQKQAEQLELFSHLKVEGTGFAEITLPSTMEIVQATVKQMQVAGGQVSAHPVVVEAVQVQPKQIASQGYEVRLSGFRQHLARLNRRQYQIYQYLTEHNKAMTVGDLARALGAAESTIQHSLPPDSFFGSLKLMRKTRSGNAFVYRSLLRDHLAREFAGGDVEDLVVRLFSR
jgi:hypothetical protein